MIDLRAEWQAAAPVAGKKVAEGLWLQVDVGRPLTEEEVGFLAQGLQFVASEIKARASGPVLVRIAELDFNPCDYQPEGLAPALAGWAAQEFGFPKPKIPVVFDRERKRYVFTFAPIDQPTAPD